MAVRPAPSVVLLTIMLELSVVGIMVLIAGASNDVANVMLIILVSAWFVYLIGDSKAFEALIISFDRLTQNPTNPAGTQTTVIP
jgi:hypothetical protein